MIVDEVKIHLKAGKGGEGSFCMVALVPTRKVVGGGGTSGRGGDCILKVTPHLYDLNKFREKRNYFAPDGIRGRENNKTGKGGEDMIVPVPAGTLIRDLDGQVVVDMLEPDQEFLVCRGGSGGEGNYKRDYTTPAQEGEELEAVLDYRIPNDVAVVGLPNSGKTSLVNALTNRTFKVADYPFTTSWCAWAQVPDNGKSVTIMDTPPVHTNPARKTDNRWLRHLLRTKIVLFVSDNFQDWESDFTAFKRAVSLVEPGILKGKKIFYLLNKIDTIESKPGKSKAVGICVHDTKGVNRLKEKIFKELRKIDEKNSSQDRVERDRAGRKA